MLHDSSITPEILLVEDSPGDRRLIEEAIKESGGNFALHIVADGIQALNFLFKKDNFASARTPDLILLDLNIPKENGHKVLAEIKKDPDLKRIPVIVLTISQNKEDILQCYNLHANCYITKPFEIDKLIQIIQSIKAFWFDVVTLPPKKENAHD